MDHVPLLAHLASDPFSVSPSCCRAEILSAPGGTAKVIQLMYRGILDGQASAGRFLELLATSRSEAVQVGSERGWGWGVAVGLHMPCSPPCKP